MITLNILDFKKAFILFASVVLLAGCKKDKEKDDNTSVDAFLGIYEVEEDCDSNKDYYTIVIKKSGSSNEVLIENFFDMEETIKASVEGEILTIKSQKIDEYTFNGTGSLNKSTNTLMIKFSYYEDGYDCTAKCIKP